jgi:hypothetical protein
VTNGQGRGSMGASRFRRLVDVGGEFLFGCHGQRQGAGCLLHDGGGGSAGPAEVILLVGHGVCVGVCVCGCVCARGCITVKGIVI